MPTESGFQNQKKYGDAQYKTIQGVGSSKFGVNTAQMYLYDITPAALPVVAAAIDSTNPKIVYVEITGHGAKEGDVLRVQSPAVLAGLEFDIIEVIDANIVGIYDLEETIIQVADDVKICRWITAKADSEGALTTSSGPTQFTRNGATQVVVQDTATPANNRGLPTLNFIMKDGVQVPVTKDTATPANTIGMPVEIVSLAGVPINITAGDINVQLSHSGANPDSTRIGDGTTEWGIEAVTKKGLVKDADVLAAINLQAKLSDTQPVSGTFWQATQPVSAAALPLPAGASTEATLLAQATLIGAVIETAPATDTASSGLNGRLQRIAQRITSLIALLPVSLGQKTMANSLAVTLASDQSALSIASPDTTASGNITTQNLVPAGTATANSAVEIALNGQGTVGIQVTGVYTGALSAQATIDGSVWVTLNAILISSTGAIAATITSASTGIYQLETAGYNKIRITGLAVMTGTAAISLRATRSEGMIALDAPLPVGANIIGALTANQSVNVVQLGGVAITMGSGVTGTGVQRVVLATDVNVPVASASIAGTITQVQATVGTSAVRATVAGTAPSATRKKLWVKPSKNNTGAVYIGASTVTTANGMEIIGPDRMEFEFDSGDYYLISDTAAQVVEIVEKV